MTKRKDPTNALVFIGCSLQSFGVFLWSWRVSHAVFGVVRVVMGYLHSGQSCDDHSSSYVNPHIRNV
jgi:hypothetical protein